MGGQAPPSWWFSPAVHQVLGGQHPGTEFPTVFNPDLSHLWVVPGQVAVSEKLFELFPVKF